MCSIPLSFVIEIPAIGVQFLNMIYKNIQIKGCACIKSIRNYRFACIQHLIIKIKQKTAPEHCALPQIVRTVQKSPLVGKY